MKLIYSLLICLTHVLFANAQTQSGKVIYKVKPPQTLMEYADTTGMLPAQLYATKIGYNKTKKVTPILEFTLSFNQNEALFKHPLYMNNGNGLDMRHAPGKINAKGAFYVNLKENLKVRQISNFGKLWRIHSRLDSVAWQITTESKVINGYTCYKATSCYRANFLVSKPITAWFCPALPFRFGPMGLAGLPGLILAVEWRNYYIYPQSIALNKKSKTIKLFKKGDWVAPETYYKAEEEASNAFLKQFE